VKCAKSKQYVAKKQRNANTATISHIAAKFNIIRKFIIFKQGASIKQIHVQAMTNQLMFGEYQK
jgi:hypothetical protein